MKKKLFIVGLLICSVVLSSIPLFTANAEETKLTIGIWATNPETREYLQKELFPNFEKQNPGVKIEIQWLDVNKINEQLLAGFAAGTAPDLFQGGISSFPALYGSQGKIMNLDKFTNSWKDKRNFFDSAWRTGIYKGHVYGIPLSFDVRPLWYRKDFFKEAGLNPNSPPQTWDQLLRMATKLTKKEGNKVVRSGFWVPTTSFDSIQSGWFHFIVQNGAPGLLNEDLKSVAFDSPEAIEGIKFYYDLLWKYNVDVLGGVPTAIPTVPVVAGTSAMAYAGSGQTILDMKKYMSSKYEDLGVTLPLKKKKRAAFLGGTILMMNSQTKYPDVAWKLMAYWAKPENIIKYALADNQLPPVKNVGNNPTFNDPRYKVALDTVRYGVPWPPSAHHGEYRMKIVAMSEAIMQNIKPLEQAIKETASEINAILDGN
ncbi:MAG TPA: ABC transporter substrate-binding protein [Methanothermobacter sp.]|nr:ABC transporter substrate-binding protein [Methanothermobacter sp.]